MFSPPKHLIRVRKIALHAENVYGSMLYEGDGATLDDLREAVTTLEDAEPIARRALGRVHPIARGLAIVLRRALAALRAREASPGEPVITTS